MVVFKQYKYTGRKSKYYVKKNTEALVVASKKIREINADKTKCRSRHQNAK